MWHFTFGVAFETALLWKRFYYITSPPPPVGNQPLPLFFGAVIEYFWINRRTLGRISMHFNSKCALCRSKKDLEWYRHDNINNLIRMCMEIKSAVIEGRWLLNETWGSPIPAGPRGGTGWFLHSPVLENIRDDSYNILIFSPGFRSGEKDSLSPVFRNP